MSVTSGIRSPSRLLCATRTTTPNDNPATVCWYARLLSMVTKASTLPAASRSSSPFFFPAHPASGTVFTSCSWRYFFRPRGRHSSSRTRIPGHGLASDIKHRRNLFTTYRRKVIQEVIHPVANFEVVHQRLNRDAGSFKNGNARQDLWIDTDRGLN